LVAGYLYRFLNIESPPQKCDCIFVLAGKPERKVFGIDLWRRGYAPELILSVGRFEWRRFYSLGLPADGGLRQLVDATPPVERHFFVRLRDSQAKAILIPRGRLGTMTEGRQLATLLRGGAIRSLMVVSTSIHLRRTALVFRRAFRGSGIDLAFVAVPEDLSSIRRSDLRAVKEVRAAIWEEFRKYCYYRLLLSFPLHK
jgi:hypothetical protein